MLLNLWHENSLKVLAHRQQTLIVSLQCSSTEPDTGNKTLNKTELEPHHEAYKSNPNSAGF